MPRVRTPAVAPKKPGRRMRRSKRLGLAVPVKVYGQNVFGEAFREFTHMLSVNADGGLLALAGTIRKGQTILLQNRNTAEEQEFRVVHVGQLQDGKWNVGIEFMHRSPDFWRIYFPPLASKSG
jgi:hypothetical protein